MTKKSNQNTKKSYPFKGILPIVVGLLAAGFLAQSLLTFQLFKENNVQDNAQLARQIVDAAEKLNGPVPKDPRTGTVFISEAKLTLPPSPTDLGPLVYSYQSATEDNKPIMHLARQNDINSAKSPVLAASKSIDDTFKGVPRLQACVRGVTIAYDQKDIQQAVGSKVLSNGKTVYFSTDPLCTNESLLQYAKSIDSYN